MEKSHEQRMKPLFQAAEKTQAYFESRGWRFCFIGGLALQRWGEPRLTEDVDAILYTGLKNEDRLVTELLTKFISRVEDLQAFVAQNRVALLQMPERPNVPLDVSFAGLPYEEEVINRSSQFQFGKKFKLRTCSAEDLVVLKAFAGRPQDIADVDSVLRRQRGQLDLDYIRSRLKVLADLREDPEILDRLQKMILHRATPPVQFPPPTES